MPVVSTLPIKWIFTVVLFLLALAKAGHADDLGVSQKNYFPDELKIGPVAICQMEHAPGLLWENGSWRRVNYKLNNYIIQKVEHRRLLEGDTPSNTSCFYDLGDSRRENSEFKVDENVHWAMPLRKARLLNRCYTIKAQGDKMAESFLFADLCREDLDLESGEITITCGNRSNQYKFQPNGEILVYTTPLFDFSEVEYRDSILVEAGKCSSLF